MALLLSVALYMSNNGARYGGPKLPKTSYRNLSITKMYLFVYSLHSISFTLFISAFSSFPLLLFLFFSAHFSFILEMKQLSFKACHGLAFSFTGW